MGLFTFIVCFLILLLIVIIIGSIQEFSLWVVTKKSNEFVVMIIPAIVSLAAFIITTISTYFILLKGFNINCLNIIYSMLLNWEYSFNDYISMLLGYIVCALIFIVLQAFCLKLSNINYSKIPYFIKHKILKKEEIKTLSASEETQQEGKVSVDLTHNALPVKKIKISFLYYLSASLFTFAISFFSIFLLAYIGTILGEKYIL